MAVDAKQNFLECVRFGTPDRVPCSRSLPVLAIGYFGVNPEDNRPPGAETWTDLWQVRHRHSHEGVMPFPVFHPLQALASWEDYRWPDPHDPALYAAAREAVRGAAHRSELILAASHRSTLLERAWKLAGMEDLFVAMLEEPRKVHRLLDRILEFQLGVAEEYLALGVEMATLGDDHGTQRAPLVSLAAFREFFKPRYARLVSLYKAEGCLVSFHSCGSVRELAPELMDIGVDILNPAQATANDLAELRRPPQGRMALQGGVSSHTIMQGPPRRVRAEVEGRIRLLGREGGYICGPDQGMPFPPAHIEALERAVADFGAYPLPDPDARG